MQQQKPRLVVRVRVREPAEPADAAWLERFAAKLLRMTDAEFEAFEALPAEERFRRVGS
jgi:hypothetical protein